MPAKPSPRRAAKPRLDPMHAQSPVWEHVDEALKTQIALRRPAKSLRDRAIKIADRLEVEFPSAFCALDFKTPLQLLVATILSAQCTDARVNQVTPELFKVYRNAKDFANTPEGELEEAIRPTGFFNNKAKAIRGAARSIVEDFGGKVPSAMEDLLMLRGTARKTANVVRMHAFGLPGISVDTHFMRIMQRLGFTSESAPEKIEADAAALLPPERWTRFTDAVILHGRKTCQSRSPKCAACCLADLCPSAGTFEK